MATVAPWRITTDQTMNDSHKSDPLTLSYLTLTQWFSPSFPLGSFAYSHGLEVAISEGKVTCATTLESWLKMTLMRGAGRVDSAILSLVLSGENAEDMADFARAIAGTKERWEETFEQGRAFARTLNTMQDTRFSSLPNAALPVVVGLAARGLEMPKKTVISLYLSSFTSNLVSAAVRFVPLGQSEGQKTLAALHPVIETVANAALNATFEDLTTSSFAADLDAARHEDMEVRIFKS